MPTIAVYSRASSRILAESLQPPDEPLTLLFTPATEVAGPRACRGAARALLELQTVPPRPPVWLAEHQVPALIRVLAILDRYGGAVLADAVGLGKSYVALAVAQAQSAPLVLVVPAVLLRQWNALLRRLELEAVVVTHERMSTAPLRREPAQGSLIVVDEAHRFRNPGTRRYRALARLAVGARVVLVTATPVHNHSADLIHLLRLFLRDDALVALGVPSLGQAARDGHAVASLAAAAARLVVARSRRRIVSAWPGVRFPAREAGIIVRPSPADPQLVSELAADIGRLRPPGAAALFRFTLLRRLASSVPALRQSLRRYEAFREVALHAAAAQRRLTAREFHRWFPMADEADLQLAFLPLLLDAGDAPAAGEQDLAVARRLLESARVGVDPKADALTGLLAATPGKTIVFVDAAATLTHLRSRLAGQFRVGAVAGSAAWLGRDRARRDEVLEAFAPRATGRPPPHPSREVDVLLATDLLGEGLNLQDAVRVIHYDLPWSPARLAQRVGRIDRLASPHDRISTASFLPPEPLASALAIEWRLAAKLTLQLAAGAAQVETPRGRPDADAPLDWCDRLYVLAQSTLEDPPAAAAATVAASVDRCVLVVRLGELVEAIVVDESGAAADPGRATDLLERAAVASSRPLDRPALARALRLAAPLIRERLASVAAARWRAPDRDRPGRRLIPWALAAARRAARCGDDVRLQRLDALVARLAGGLTAGEELQLQDLLARRRQLTVRDLLTWHERLPPPHTAAEAPVATLVAAVVLTRGGNAPPAAGSADALPTDGLSRFDLRRHF